MADSASSSANAVASTGFAAGGFQLKGTSKRKIITISDDKSDFREAVLGIEKGVIKSVSGPQSDQVHLIIPLAPSRVDIVRAVRSIDNHREKYTDLPVIDAENGLIPKTLEQLAADELIAEMTGDKERSIDNLHSIPVIGGSEINKGLKAAPLLAASLAPELIGLRDDDERFKADINTRPDDIGVRSDAYKVVRIEDFGAAMLRGMGWSGVVEEKKEEEKIVPRDNRLGLGAFLSAYYLVFLYIKSRNMHLISLSSCLCDNNVTYYCSVRTYSSICLFSSTSFFIPLSRIIIYCDFYC